jgi:membrane fusion protein (multidrug efflux system)
VLQGIGTLASVEKVMLSPELSGRVKRIHFRDGESVAQGELLVSLDAVKLKKRLQARQSGLREARARMKNARRSYRRQQTLYDKGVGSEEARDEALTAFTAAQAKVDRLQSEIEELRETIADTRIRAPFGGTLGEARVDSGEFVRAGAPLVLLTQKDQLEVSFTVPERYMDRVRVGQNATFTVPGHPEDTFPGTVTFLNPVIEESTRSLRIKASVANSAESLRPGGFASVRLTVGQRKNAAVIPEEALIPTRKGYMVFIVQNGTAQTREVKIGLRKPGIVEIRKGLEPGQSVIASGHISVQAGDRVCGKDGD